MHELLSLLELTLATKESLDELDTGILAELGILTLLPGAKHGGLARLEELAKLVGEALTSLDEFFDHLLVVLGTDLGNGLLGALDLSGQLDEEKPKLASHVRDGSGRSMVVDGPVIDPLSEGVGIKDTAEKHDGLLGRIPVLERVSSGDPVPLGISLRGLAGYRGRWWLLLLGSDGPGGLRPLWHRG